MNLPFFIFRIFLWIQKNIEFWLGKSLFLSSNTEEHTNVAAATQENDIPLLSAKKEVSVILPSDGSEENCLTSSVVRAIDSPGGSAAAVESELVLLAQALHLKLVLPWYSLISPDGQSHQQVCASKKILNFQTLDAFTRLS